MSSVCSVAHYFSQFYLGLCRIKINLNNLYRALYKLGRYELLWYFGGEAISFE
jgi:hypothetical protein